MIKKVENGKVINFGCRFDRYDSRDYMYMAAPMEIPFSIDNTGQIARIMNQNPEGACPGHAVCAAAEFHYWK